MLFDAFYDIVEIRYMTAVISGHSALTPPGPFFPPLCDDHIGNMQVIHFWATDLVDQFNSGEVKWGNNGAITLGVYRNGHLKFAGYAARLSIPQEGSNRTIFSYECYLAVCHNNILFMLPGIC